MAMGRFLLMISVMFVKWLYYLTCALYFRLLWSYYEYELNIPIQDTLIPKTSGLIRLAQVYFLKSLAAEFIYFYH